MSKRRVGEGVVTPGPMRRRARRRGMFALAFVLVGGGPMHAQDDPGPCDPPSDPKVVKLLADADKARDPSARHQKLKAALEESPECAECLFRAGVSAYRIARSSGRSFTAAMSYLQRLQQLCPNYHADVPYLLGSMHYADGAHAEAVRAFTVFLEFPETDPKRLDKDHRKRVAEVEELMPDLRFQTEFYANTAPLDPVPLAGVNTEADEYLPMLSPDNDLLFFTRLSKRRALGDLVARDVEELTESRARNGVFDAGRALPEPFNQGDSYGGVTISVNNKEMFVTICGAPDARGYRNCDIHRAHYDNHVNIDRGEVTWEWSRLETIGEAINGPDTWESQPTITADGRTMYFATNRPGSKGMDIYMSTRDEKGVWSKAVPVPGINTDGDEKAPFLHSDSRTLYFAARPPVDENGQPDLSRGHRGAGGYDIFFSRMNDDGSWTKPRNLGHPINTEADEHGLIVSADGRTAYFASNRYRGKGGLDIFGIPLPQEARPDDILVVKGEVRDETGAVVRDAHVEIKYLDTRTTETIRVDDRDGTYATVLRLREGGDVVVTVKKEGHVFDTRSFSVEDTVRRGRAEVDMTVHKVAVGKSYRVNDIKYATNSAEITKASEYILDELIAFLKDNPGMRIRIEGHTDNVGRLDDNMKLSDDRANNVMRYLVGKGISASRLSYKGLGPTRPVASNDTPEGRAQNRRTEFVIVSR